MDESVRRTRCSPAHDMLRLIDGDKILVLVQVSLDSLYLNLGMYGTLEPWNASHPVMRLRCVRLLEDSLSFVGTLLNLGMHP